MFFEIILAVLIASLIALDRTAIVQVMISQPIVASPIIGYLLGDFLLGLKIGIAVQLLWLPALQIGAAIVPNSSLASLLICIVSVVGEKLPQLSIYSAEAVCGIVFISVLPLMWIEEKIDTFVRKKNYLWFVFARNRIAEGDTSSIGVANLGGTLFFFIKNFVFLCISAFFLTNLFSIVIPHLPRKIMFSFEIFFKILPLAGISAVLGELLNRKYYFLFATGVIIQMVIVIIYYIL
ncbi:MAG: hypothetical protein D6734_04000 [Candidatus Schekmanbacteria bacterium]|nr:MAG: hypothetical protein D6734_04000 [Candidatus Schekmanbacteria bacterium]